MLILLLIRAALATRRDPAADQIVMFKENTPGPIGIMTTSAGAPVEYEEATNTLNSRLIFNEFFMDSITHLVRERIPERIVHAKAGGAFGYFEVTHDVTHICKAKLFSKVGKRTPVAARFSPVVVERGGSDTSRDARGFAVKFYTEDGNFDIVGFNTPMYVYNDPRLFPTFVRAQKKNPANNLFDPNTLWDFLTLQPESLHMFLLVFGDRGIPDGYQHMPGFGIHTFQVVNEHGDSHFVRFHFVPDAGIKNLRSEEARKIGAEDADYNTRELYRAIGNGEFPSWTVSIQVLTLDEVKTAGFNVFDVTLVLPLDDYPLQKLGRLVLNKNAVNYFAEIEQLAFSPANLVPGILGAPDKLFEARRLSYRDAQYYRLGANFNKIPVNCPFRTEVFAYNRDGRAPVKDNDKDTPNYFPNSFHGPVPYIDKSKGDLIEIVEEKANNFIQSRELYVNEMTNEERNRLVENILYSLGPATQFIKDRAVKVFMLIHPDLGTRIEHGLSANVTNKLTSYEPYWK
ncbi:catalase [Danaus plexippus plexippus]|uniref:Catalase n=1 Tax=Danaus plexippus plexippus TaxID=278856 RepID=A0A212F4X0_DANPL|nr:catalase-like [Danaus plexippus plexippus]OWR48787.1 catalase [Danaus plexippus plexippus]